MTVCCFRLFIGSEQLPGNQWSYQEVTGPNQEIVRLTTHHKMANCLYLHFGFCTAFK